MVWNYRVIHLTAADGTDWYAIHEVYYDNEYSAPKMVTTDSVCVGGEDIEELKQDMAHYLEALSRPVLEYDEIGKKSF